MKARFALDLSESRISLLHRGASGWQPVGAVQMDDADLELNVAMLRGKAEAYSGEAVRADVIVPQELVLYMQLPRMPERDAEDHIVHALHGRTPYALHQLAYDYEFEDGMCLVAIVARESLREAHDFAAGHGIEIASFATAPDPDGDRRHIPNFPLEAMIEPEPAVVEPVVEAAVVEALEEPAAGIDTAALAEAAIAASDLHGPVDMRAALAEAAEDAAVETASAAVESAVEEEDEIEIPEAPVAAEEEEETVAVFESSVSAVDPDHGAAEETGAMRAALSRGDLDADADDHVISFGPAAERAAREERGVAPRFDERRTVSESRSRLSFDPVGGPERTLSIGIAGSGRDMPPASTTSFAARRAAIASITGIESGTGSAIAARSEARPFASQIELPKPETPRDESDAMTVFGARGVPEPRLVAARAMFAVAAAVVLLIGLGAFTASWLFGPDDPLGREEPVALLPAEPVEVAPVAEAGAETPAPVVTVEAPAPAEAPVPEFAAIDALIEETDEAVETVEAEIAAPEAPGVNPVEAALSEALGLAAPAPEAAPLPSLADIAGQPAAGFAARPASAVTPTGDLPQESDIVAPSGDVMSREAILASYAATGIWPVAPGAPATPGEEPVEVRLPQSGDAALRRAVGGLVAPADLGAQPVSAVPPVGPGITFDLDERGLVTATPEGTLNPEGILVYAGAPLKRPPLRVVRQPEPDARVIGAKPKARPEIDPETVSRLEEANAAAVIRTRALEGAGPNGFVLGPQDVAVRALHEGRKPRARPSADSADASGAVSAEEAREALFRPENPVIDDPTVSGFAVAVSARPSARPKGIAASAAAPASPEVAPQAATPAVVRSTGPQLPTRASVARAATTPDAIKLRAVNLIGVYGTKTKRRALVRLKNGKFLKVRVGDRIDGGVVRAIGENALQYQKGNKQLVIALPQT